MKRDMDLIRALLLEAEKAPFGGAPISLPGHSQEEIYYHAQLAQDARLIEARLQRGPEAFHIIRLTYEGHEFLEAARNEERWARAKETVIRSTGTLTLEAVKAALAALVKNALGA